MHPTSSCASIEELALTNNTQQRQLPMHQYLFSPQHCQRLQHVYPPPSNKNKSYLCQFMIIAKRRWKLIIKNFFILEL